MKKQVYDLQSITPDLDADDQALMSLFPAHRESDLNEMYLVRQGGETYLLRKEDVARFRKMVKIIVNLTAWAIGLSGLAVGLFRFIHKLSYPWIWLIPFDLCLARYLMKVPSEVKGYFEK